MFNKTRVRLLCFTVSFFKVRLPISIKRLCAWLNIFSFFIRSLTKQGTPVSSFLLCIFLVVLVLPCSPPAREEEEEETPHFGRDCVGLA